MDKTLFQINFFTNLIKKVLKMSTITTAKERCCVVCEKVLFGRADKVFCSSRCKNHYHLTYKKEKRSAAFQIDSILTKNYQIIAGLMVPGTIQLKIAKLALEKAGFNFAYFTHLDQNEQKCIYQFILNFEETDTVIIEALQNRKIHHPFIYERWIKKISPTQELELD
jgi:predicted nucleic acid-binding Zn ribbon protein